MNYSVSYFHQIQDMAELFNTFYPFRLVPRQEDPELADQLFAVLAQIEVEYFMMWIRDRNSRVERYFVMIVDIVDRAWHREESWIRRMESGMQCCFRIPEQLDGFLFWFRLPGRIRCV